MGCLRGGLGVLVGYLAMSVVMFVVFTGVFVILGADGSFQESTYDVSMVWAVQYLVVGFVAALLGGWVCTKVAPTQSALTAFLIVFLLLNAGMVVVAIGAEDPGPRTGEVGNFEAMQTAVTPLWASAGYIVLGLLGAWMGGKKNAKARR